MCLPQQIFMARSSLGLNAPHYCSVVAKRRRLEVRAYAKEGVKSTIATHVYSPEIVTVSREQMEGPTPLPFLAEEHQLQRDLIYRARFRRCL